MPSKMPRISTSVKNEVSQSIWVNSGWLAVGAQVFVAKAFGDLVIAVEAGNHQHLLEQLRRLRQREEHAVMHTRGHQVVARALGGGARQHRCLDIDEALRIEIAAYRHRHLVAQHQIFLHQRAPQVDHAVLQTHHFADVGIVDLERRRYRGVEDLQFLGHHLDLAAGKLGVDKLGLAPDHPAGHADHVLAANPLGGGENAGTIRVAHHLHDAFAVAQVDENHAAMIAAGIDPAHEGNALVEVAGIDPPAVVGTHVSRLSRKIIASGQQARTDDRWSAAPPRPSRRCT